MAATTKKSESFRVVTGLDYPTPAGGKRAEPGKIVDDLPAHSVEWLLEQGHIERVKKAA